MGIMIYTMDAKIIAEEKTSTVFMLLFGAGNLSTSVAVKKPPFYEKKQLFNKLYCHRYVV